VQRNILDKKCVLQFQIQYRGGGTISTVLAYGGWFVPGVQLSSFHFVVAKRLQNDKTMIIVYLPRKDNTTKQKADKTTKLGRKDDKHNSLISDLICRLFTWRVVVFLP
jgi:hypothetical protein